MRLSGEQKPRVLLDAFASVGLAAAGVVSSPWWAEERIKKAVGPDLAHGSWFVRSAVLPPAV